MGCTRGPLHCERMASMETVLPPVHNPVLLTLLISISLAGCATPAPLSDAALTSYDKHTEYSLEENPTGFLLTVNYARYQFIPESPAVAMACKSALTSIAYEIAARKGKALQSINEQQIKLSMGRNGVTGITSCSAQVPVRWV